MITSRKHLLWAALLASATFASTGVLAQAPITAPVPAAAEAQAGAPAKAQHKHMDPAERLERMRAHRAKRLAALKDKLQLSPGQDSAWTIFAESRQPRDGAAGHRRIDRAELAKMTTPERLDRMQARQAERSATFAKRAEATRSFYAQLSPEQQKTFDAESMKRFGPDRRGHRHHHGHGGDRHHGQEAPATTS